MTRPRPADIARQARRVTMTGLLDRLTRRAKLTDAELLLLRAQWEIETTEAELAEKARRGLDRQRDQMTVRLQAADDTIREIEHDLDRARQQLLAAQQETTDAVTRAEKAEAEVERMKLLVAASSEDGQAARMAARFAEKANENQHRAEKAEAAIARVRALHAPTANLSWPAFSCTCESVSTHTRACSQCQRCHPCPTLRALDGTT